MAVTVAQTTEEPGELPVVAEISRDIVGIYRRFHGRGPTKAKTTYRDDLIVTILGDVFTRSEDFLVAAGRFDMVRANRLAFHDEAEPLFRHAIEVLTARTVLSCLGQLADDGTAAEVFVLASA